MPRAFACSNQAARDSSLRVIAFGVVLWVSGCGDGLIDPPDNSIGRFLRSEGINKIYSLESVMVIPETGTTIFLAQFGQQDCPSGCFPYSVYGLQFNERIGWLGRSNSGLRNTALFFDFRPDDDYLFSSAFIGNVPRDYNASWAVIESMTRDPDTSVEGLLNVIVLVEAVGLPGHALELLDHPNARTSRTVLEAIASIRDSRLSNFKLARDEANRRLAALGQSQ